MSSVIKLFLLLILLSAVPIAYIIHSETSLRHTHTTVQYHSGGWLRECVKWDDKNRRFIVSFVGGGVGVIPVPEYHEGDALEEISVVDGGGLGKNSSLGLAIDGGRHRVVVAIADVVGNKYSAVAAYDWTTWDRIFLTQLSGADVDRGIADDVAVDSQGNAYVTDVKGSKIWKVGVTGELLYAIQSPLFLTKQWYLKWIGLNGIVYHPNGYLLVVHTLAGKLFKVEIGNGDRVKEVYLTPGSGSCLRFGDGLELLSPTKLVVAGNPTRLVESSDDWENGRVVGKFDGVKHRLVTSATVKDGKVYVNHILGLGYPKRKHVLLEADFGG